MEKKKEPFEKPIIEKEKAKIAIAERIIAKEQEKVAGRTAQQKRMELKLKELEGKVQRGEISYEAYQDYYNKYQETVSKGRWATAQAALRTEKISKGLEEQYEVYTPKKEEFGFVGKYVLDIETPVWWLGGKGIRERVVTTKAQQEMEAEITKTIPLKTKVLAAGPEILKFGALGVAGAVVPPLGVGLAVGYGAEFAKDILVKPTETITGLYTGVKYRPIETLGPMGAFAVGGFATRLRTPSIVKEKLRTTARAVKYSLLEDPISVRDIVKGYTPTEVFAPGEEVGVKARIREVRGLRVGVTAETFGGVKLEKGFAEFDVAPPKLVDISKIEPVSVIRFRGRQVTGLIGRERVTPPKDIYSPLTREIGRVKKEPIGVKFDIARDIYFTPKQLQAAFEGKPVSEVPMGIRLIGKEPPIAKKLPTYEKIWDIKGRGVGEIWREPGKVKYEAKMFGVFDKAASLKMFKGVAEPIRFGTGKEVLAGMRRGKWPEETVSVKFLEKKDWELGYTPKLGFEPGRYQSPFVRTISEGLGSEIFVGEMPKDVVKPTKIDIGKGLRERWAKREAEFEIFKPDKKGVVQILKTKIKRPKLKTEQLQLKLQKVKEKVKKKVKKPKIETAFVVEDVIVSEKMASKMARGFATAAVPLMKFGIPTVFAQPQQQVFKLDTQQFLGIKTKMARPTAIAQMQPMAIAQMKAKARLQPQMKAQADLQVQLGLQAELQAQPEIQTPRLDIPFPKVPKGPRFKVPKTPKKPKVFDYEPKKFKYKPSKFKPKFSFPKQFFKYTPTLGGLFAGPVFGKIPVTGLFTGLEMRPFFVKRKKKRKRR